MEDKISLHEELRHWLLVDPLTLEQAAKLSVGASPNFGRPVPLSFTPLLQALQQAIGRGEIPAETEVNMTEGRKYSLDALDKTHIQQRDMNAWLRKRQITGAFFFLRSADYWPANDAWRPWAKQDLWSHGELAEICSGIIPGTPNRTSAEQTAINQALEKIARGTLLGTLKFVSRSDSDTQDRLYNTYRHYVPVTAAEWAMSRFETFPAALIDALAARKAGSAVEAPEQSLPKLRSDREQNLLRVIAGLWALAELPGEPTKTADKLSALFDSWKWDKPAKGTMADTILKDAAKLPGAIIRK